MNNRDNKKTVICHLSNLGNIKIGGKEEAAQTHTERSEKTRDVRQIRKENGDQMGAGAG